jgi:predicted amidohydrolase
MTCNDVRYPEQARALRLQARCQMLVVPAWWPWRRDHVWRTLLRARAIENGVWTAGCCIEASVFPGEDFAGAGNHVYDPLGEPVRTADDHTFEIDLDHPPQLVVDPLEHPSPPMLEEVQIVDGGGPPAP